MLGSESHLEKKKKTTLVFSDLPSIKDLICFPHTVKNLITESQDRCRYFVVNMQSLIYIPGSFVKLLIA